MGSYPVLSSQNDVSDSRPVVTAFEQLATSSLTRIGFLFNHKPPLSDELLSLLAKRPWQEFSLEAWSYGENKQMQKTGVNGSFLRFLSLSLCCLVLFSFLSVPISILCFPTACVFSSDFKAASLQKLKLSLPVSRSRLSEEDATQASSWFVQTEGEGRPVWKKQSSFSKEAISYLFRLTSLSNSWWLLTMT